jgi:hypothetical protein
MRLIMDHLVTVQVFYTVCHIMLAIQKDQSYFGAVSGAGGGAEIE